MLRGNLQVHENKIYMCLNLFKWLNYDIKWMCIGPCICLKCGVILMVSIQKPERRDLTWTKILSIIPVTSHREAPGRFLLQPSVLSNQTTMKTHSHIHRHAAANQTLTWRLRKCKFMHEAEQKWPLCFGEPCLLCVMHEFLSQYCMCFLTLHFLKNLNMFSWLVDRSRGFDL